MSLLKTTRWSILFPLLLLFALLAPATAAQSATKLRQVQVQVPAQPQNPSQKAGTLTLDLVFKNKRGSKRKFTPRLLTRIEFDQIPLTCGNEQGGGTSQFLLSDTLDTNVKFTKSPQPAGKKPKPGRYAYRFSYAFEDFTGKLSGTIDKPNTEDGKLRSQGKFQIDDLDANPGHTNCSSSPFFGWGGLPVTGA